MSTRTGWLGKGALFQGWTGPTHGSPEPEPLTDLLLDGMQQVDVILRHQCDGLSLPPCGDTSVTGPALTRGSSLLDSAANLLRGILGKGQLRG